MPGGSKKGGGLEYKPFKMRGTPFQRNFGIGRTNAPDATTPLSNAPINPVTDLAQVGQTLKGKLEATTDKRGDFFKKTGIQIGKNVEILGGGSGQDKPENWDTLSPEEQQKWESQRADARQKGWGQVLAKSLSAGMRTLPGGYDAYNPPGKVDIMKQLEGLDTEQQQALLASILGDDYKPKSK